MAVELGFGIFEAVGVDFGVIFEVEVNIDCRVPNVLDFDIFLVDVVDGDVEVELQFID